MASDPTFFRDDSVIALREVEVPNASFANGMNNGGSNAPGVGINMGEGAVVGTFPQFTLLDQHGDARAAQISQAIGGEPYVLAANYPSSGGLEGTAPDDVIQFGTLPTQAAKDADPTLDGTVIVTGGSALPTLAGGWVVQI